MSDPGLSLPIRTPRLVLRGLVADDLDDHHRLFSDPEVVRFLYDEPVSREQAVEHLGVRLEPRLPEEGRWMNLAVLHEGRYLGEVGASLRSAANRQCEVGYVFLREARGQGFATEAAAAMVTLCVEVLGAHRVTARLDARNHRSAAVAVRLGMRHEALLVENEWVKGEWTDEAVYAITEREWRERA